MKKITKDYNNYKRFKDNYNNLNQMKNKRDLNQKWKNYNKKMID